MLPCFGDRGSFEIGELSVTAGDAIAFCQGLIRCGGSESGGDTVELVVRQTVSETASVRASGPSARRGTIPARRRARGGEGDGSGGAALEFDAWAAVSAAQPCPCCGTADGCSVATRQAFVRCRGAPSAWPADGGGWFHRLLAVEGGAR